MPAGRLSHVQRLTERPCDPSRRNSSAQNTWIWPSVTLQNHLATRTPSRQGVARAPAAVTFCSRHCTPDRAGGGHHVVEQVRRGDRGPWRAEHADLEGEHEDAPPHPPAGVVTAAITNAAARAVIWAQAPLIIWQM